MSKGPVSASKNIEPLKVETIGTGIKIKYSIFIFISLMAPIIWSLINE